MSELSLTQQSYMKKRRRYKQTVQLIRYLILIVFILQWEVTTRLDLVDSFIFSSPSRVLKTIYKMAVDSTLFSHVGITLLETFASFILVVGIGLIVATILWLSPRFAHIMEPYLVVLNSLPKSALAPLFIVWFGANIKTIIIAGISVALFGAIISLYTSFQNIDENKLKLIRILGGGKKDMLLKVIYPASIPTIISTMKVNIGLALVGVVIGEFIGARQGLGYLIIYGTQTFQLDLVIMSIVLLCLIAMGLYSFISRIEKACKKGGR